MEIQPVTMVPTGSGPAIKRQAFVTKAAVLLLAGVIVTACATASQTATPTAGVSCPCATTALTAVPGGLSRDAAIAAAQRYAPPAATKPTVVWAWIAQDPFASPSASGVRLVWEVRLQGSMAASPCPSASFARPPDEECLDGYSGLVVVLDVYTGALIGWTH